MTVSQRPGLAQGASQLPGFYCMGVFVTFKMVSLFMLTAQNVLSVLFMRIARTQEGPAFVSGTVIIMSELLKAALCVLLILREKRSLWDTVRSIHSEVFANFSGTLQMSVPALCYTFQNFMVFVAITRLDVTTYATMPASLPDGRQSPQSPA